jgi:hypothetical protein
VVNPRVESFRALLLHGLRCFWRAVGTSRLWAARKWDCFWVESVHVNRTIFACRFLGGCTWFLRLRYVLCGLRVKGLNTFKQVQKGMTKQKAPLFYALISSQ